VIGYVSRTGTLTTLAALRRAGWRLLTEPQHLAKYGRARARPHWEDGSPAPYCLDNGAWRLYNAGLPFDVAGFQLAVDLVGADADFITCPDIVAGGLASLSLSLEWLPRLDGIGGRRLLAVQDGMVPADVEPHLGDVGIFVGGSTDWKLATMHEWGNLAARVGCYLHVARVNTRRRIRMCQDAGADSFDGTGPCQFPSTLPKLDRAVRQQHLFGGDHED
jgi:hypothetical protein